MPPRPKPTQEDSSSSTHDGPAAKRARFTVEKIQYKGPLSRDPLSFKHYNETEEVLGKTMKDWLRFSVCFWHTWRGAGRDMFGEPTAVRPWDDGS